MSDKTPVFELYGPNGEVWKLYLDGRCEGFPEGTVIVNKALLIMQAYESVKSVSSISSVHSKEHFDESNGMYRI